jgi:hypothetical protein
VTSQAANLDFESGPARVDHLIDRRTMDLEARARQITGGRAGELILDAIGGVSPKKVIAYLRRPAGSGCLAFRRRLPTRREGCFAAVHAREQRTISDTLRLGASDNEGVNLWIGYGAIYVQGKYQS